MKRLFKIGSDRHEVGKVIFSWNCDGNFLASVGKNGIVQITDRHGDIVDEIRMENPSPVTFIEWDKDGNCLAILQEGSGIVPLWNLSTRNTLPLETNLKDPTFIAWSKSSPHLAIGTAKGNLLIYNKVKKQKIPVLGKHSKRILCGCWSQGGNKLVLGSEDKSLTISNEAGETLIHTELKNVPYQTFFAYKKHGNNPNGADNIVSANLAGKSLLLFNILDEKDDPLELTFAAREGSGSGCKYGNLVHHEWFDDGFIMIGFSEGWIIIVSTNEADLGEEKQSVRVHPSSLAGFSFNKALKKLATAGSDGVRISDIKNFKDSKYDFIPIADLEDGRVTDLNWSPDGQILTIATSSGNIYNFLAKMSVLSTHYKTSIAYLSSLREVSIIDVSKRHKPIDLWFKIEPSLIALGSRHVVAAINNRAYYHRISSSSNNQKVIENEYIGTIKDIKLNSTYAAVLADNKIYLHSIEPTSPDKRMTFPSRDEGSYSKISCLAMNDDFLFFGTEGGTVEMFYLSEWVLLAGVELRIDNSIKSIYPNPLGTRIVIVDSYSRLYLFNPVTGGGYNQSIIPFEETSEQGPESIQSVSNVLWDLKEKNIIVVVDAKYFHTFVYVAESIKGPLLIKLGPVEVGSSGEIRYHPERSELSGGNIPLILSSGVLTCQTPAGAMTSVMHPYFNQINPSGLNSPNSKSRRNELPTESVADLKYKFCQAIALMKLDSAWKTAISLDIRQYWLALSNKALELLNIDLAIRVYRQLRDAGMVMALQDCLHIEDKALLAGNIFLLFSDYQKAQELFLASNRPITALEMRRDLLHWDKALKLAQTLAVEQIPEISIQYGQQLEFRDEIEPALKMFESALNITDSSGKSICPESSVPMAMMGVARCHLRLGNIRQGIRLVNELEDRSLFEDCADILEAQKQYSEAATLYLKADNYEKAGQIFIKHLIKNDKNCIDEAANIMKKVSSDQLNSQFAKICVTFGKFEEAVKAYMRAKDVDKVVEINLRNLDRAQDAFDLVRDTSSAQGALLVADYCQEVNDFRGAIEFLLIANKYEDAFRLAQVHNQMDMFTKIIGDHISLDDALKVAEYYEKSQDLGKAGKFYSLCGKYAHAMKLFFSCGDREISSAIEVVVKLRNEIGAVADNDRKVQYNNLVIQLIDYINGGTDGIPKDQNYLYKLYMANKEFKRAASTSLLIADQEQQFGNYSISHNIIVDTIRQLEDEEVRVPLELRQQFILLHSYKLAKKMVKGKDHEGASHLLLRVAQNVSKFPKHTVQILTSTVIECQRAGLKAASYEYAVILMRPEYRSMLEPNLKRKIEAIVRRRSAVHEEVPEVLSTCPISAQEIPSYKLECPTTKDYIPMCGVTGKHMVLSDWSFCPVSKFPALYSEYLKYIREEQYNISIESNQSGAATDPEEEGKSPQQMHAARARALLDPVFGKTLNPLELKLATPEDALKYIQKFNNVKQETKIETEDEKNKKEMTGTEDSDNKTNQDSREEHGSNRVRRSNAERRRHKKYSK